MNAEDELDDELAAALAALRARILARAVAEIDEPHVVVLVTPDRRSPVLAQGPFPDGMAAVAAADAALRSHAGEGLEALVLPLAPPSAE